MIKQTKKVVSLILTLTLLMSMVLLPTAKVHAEESSVKTEGDWKYKVITNGGVEEIQITGYLGKNGEVIIPNEIDGKSVTSIGIGVFYECSTLTSVTIPNSVKSIGDAAFYNCSLTSVTLPEGITSIGELAFSDCSKLTSITIPASVKSVGKYTFTDSNKLTIYGYPGSYIEEYAQKKGIPFNSIFGAGSSVAKPSALKQTSAATNSITLTWKKDSGVQYEVYRSTKSNSGYKKIETVSTNKFTDKKLKVGTTYYYKIRAIKTVANKTYNSSDSAVLKAVTKPAKAKVTLKAGKKQIKISWKKVSGAVKYEVYLSTSKKGSYKKLTTTNKVNYTKKKLKKGKKYYIKVRSYTTDGSKKKYYSEYSSIKSVKVK